MPSSLSVVESTLNWVDHEFSPANYGPVAAVTAPVGLASLNWGSYSIIRLH
jgi:hypothetical protein